MAAFGHAGNQIKKPRVERNHAKPAVESRIRHGVPPTLLSTPHLRAYQFGTQTMLLHLVCHNQQCTTCRISSRRRRRDRNNSVAFGRTRLLNRRRPAFTV